jgi:exodeoxyribonuclease VII large subunit
MIVRHIETDTSSFTLSQFLTEIKQTIDRKFKGGGYWVRGELSDWKKNGAHYYGELIEFDDLSHQSVAKVRINMWANVAHKVIPKFHHATGEQFKNGMKVLLMVDVNFHQNFGLSLNILDIEPSFTLGDREARKKKVIADLTQAGVVNNNRNLAIPTEFTNIAVISSENAAGLGDFFAEANLLQKYGLCEFETYHASMQGKDCAATVAKSFREIYKAIGSGEKVYDCVVLIRGGGSQADLDWFNYFEVANALCHIPVPVFVGIGHERDKTILDDLAARSFDTPSKVINYIANTIINNATKAQTSFESIKSITLNSTTKAKADIAKHHHYITHFAKQLLSTQKKATGDYYKLVHANAKQQLAYQRQVIDTWQSNIMQSAKKSLELSKTKIDHLNQTAMTTAKGLTQSHSNQLRTWHSNIAVNAKNTLINAKHVIESHYRGILSMSIEPTLQRGFAVTKSGDMYVTSVADARKCQRLTVTYHDGELITEVRHD